MTDFKYTYEITQFANNLCDPSRLTQEIRSSSIITSLDYMSSTSGVYDIYFKSELSQLDWTTLSGIVTNHTGEALIENLPINVNISSAASSVELNTGLEKVPCDRSGKLRVHQTSRKLGLRVMWTGIGDDTSSITKVGGGEPISFIYKVGDIEPMVKYIDFNIADNETWMHEGYMTWKDCFMDTLSLQIVPRTVTVSGVVGGNKTVYGGYLVVPTAPGSGNYEVTSDITIPSGGLVYMPNDDLDEAPTAYWDADYNKTTHKYENIRPNYTGTGRYNMFTHEVVFSEFVRQIPLLANGFIPLNSSDTDQLGQGMRVKMTADTNTLVEDHDWSIACILCLHREHSV